MPAPAIMTAASTDFASIVQDYQTHVWWYLRLLGADESLADDLTQETFLAAWKAGMQHNAPPTFGSYLRRTARSVFIRTSQQQRRRPVAMPEIEAADRAWSALHGDEPGAADDALQRLRDCVGQLAPQAQRAVRLQYEQEMSGDSVAAELGVSHGHVRVIIHRARHALRRCMEAHS